MNSFFGKAIAAITFFIGLSFAGQSMAQDFPDLGAVDVIVCKKQTQDRSRSGSKTYHFTAGECGGELPGANYIGLASEIHVCGGSVTFKVLSGRRPGINVWANNACGHVILEAVYIKISNFSVIGRRN